MAKSTIISNLETLYKELDNKWVNQNSLVINYAKGAKLAVGGSIAMAISNKKPHKIPGDFDFFTDNNEDSLKFIQNIIHWLSKRPNTHYKIQINNKTDFTLPGVSHHVRITVPFWKPICVMTLENPIRSFFYHGLKVQYFDDVVAAAKEATLKDGKPRITFDEEEAKRNIRLNMCPSCNLNLEYCICARPEVSVRHTIIPSSTSWLDEMDDESDRIRFNNGSVLRSTHNIPGVEDTCAVQVGTTNEAPSFSIWDEPLVPPVEERTSQEFYNTITSAGNNISEARRNGPAVEFWTRDSTTCPNEVESNNIIDWNFVAQTATRFHRAGIPAPCRPIDWNSVTRMEVDEETAEIASEGEVRSLSERMRRDRDDALQANISIWSNTMAYHPTRDSRDEDIVEFVDRTARARNASRALERAETTGTLTS